MMESYQNKRKVDLRDLLIAQSRAWKWIAAAAAAGAILLPLYKYLRLRSAYSRELKSFAQGVQGAAEPTPVSFPFSYIVIGLLLGLILAVLVITFRYVFSGKLKAVLELDRPKGTQLLCVFKKTQDTKAELFMKKLLHVKAPNPEGREADLLYSRLTTTCRNQEIGRIVFAGDAADEDPELLLDIAEKLRRDGIEADPIGDILGDPQAILCLNAGDGVVLVVKAGQTSYKTLDEEIAQCTRQKTKLIGFAAFE